MKEKEFEYIANKICDVLDNIEDKELEIDGSSDVPKGVEIASINIQDGGIGEKVPKLEGILNLKSGDAIIPEDCGKMEFIDIEYVNTSKKEYDKDWLS